MFCCQLHYYYLLMILICLRPDVNWIFHKFACPIFSLIIDELKMKKSGQVQRDRHADYQQDEVYWRLEKILK